MTGLGKLAGFIIGAIIFGPVGALVGLYIGHIIDQARLPNAARHSHLAQRIFFDTTFSVMGHIAKADGRVSEAEIQTARTIMTSMGLNDVQKRRAIEQFNTGKRANFNLKMALRKLTLVCHHQRTLLRMFLEIQLQAAHANGAPSLQQRQILEEISRILQIKSAHFDPSGRAHSYQPRPSQTPLAECYATLEINSKASDAEIKRAYRKLMSQHHPDKLIAKGFPEAMVKMATEKTQRIQKAYEHIREERDMK